MGRAGRDEQLLILGRARLQHDLTIRPENLATCCLTMSTGRNTRRAVAMRSTTARRALRPITAI